jgi:hypothetical protein
MIDLKIKPVIQINVVNNDATFCFQRRYELIGADPNVSIA